MHSRKLIILGGAAGMFLIALLSGPPSFDATDGAEFAVCGSELQIAHPPGYPLFLMLVRLFSMIFSPLYGHLRLLNCFIASTALIAGVAAFRQSGLEFRSALAGSILFLTAAPVMSQFNSLEVYPLAILLVLAAISLKETKLAPYTSGMALLGGHPISLLNSPLFFSLKKKWLLMLTFFIPVPLLLYVPLRSGACRIAHYGHPANLNALISYFTVYSGRFNIPSLGRLFEALAFIGIPGGIVFVLLAGAAGKFKAKRDISSILGLLFLASYELPDPAGQLWILLLPLSLRCAAGIELLFKKGNFARLIALLLVAVSAVSGVISSDRSKDDIAMLWTLDVLNSIPPDDIYRPVAHDTYYAAYVVNTLEIRPDIILSDPFGNYFEFSPPGPIPPLIGERAVHISRAWNREEYFSLQGLLFSPNGMEKTHIFWNRMAIFDFDSSSPDPMAMDIVAEAWIRRMIQEEDPLMRDSFYLKALDFSCTPTTRSRIEDIRKLF